ncbi:MAG: hypothetical protein C0622_05380 [Desulfuromonas sp.]|nr:MAG: hypothetical protein C0622_05380 [Desulfuromonas sp.]
MNQYLLLGIILGLSAGFSPGPLMTLVVAETLRHDIGSGIRVALAPLVTDLPIVLLSLFVIARLADFHSLLGLISLAGALFLLVLGWQSMKLKGVELDLSGARPQSLLKGVLTNLLSPHPYLFWISVGGPLLNRANDLTPWAGGAFLAGFYLCLIGAKVSLALVTGKSKGFLSGRLYLAINRFLGLLLILLAGLLCYDGLKLLGLV